MFIQGHSFKNTFKKYLNWFSVYGQMNCYIILTIVYTICTPMPLFSAPTPPPQTYSFTTKCK